MYVCSFGCSGSSSQCRGSSSCGGHRGYSPVVLRGLLLLQSAGSVVVARGLSLGYVESQFPDSGTEPTFPALWGGFLTTGPAGKSRLSQYLPAA